MDFKFLQVKKLDDGSYAPAISVVSNATHKDHEDIHYLYKLRKANVLLLGEEGVKGLQASQLEEIHTAIVTSMIGSDKSHWYNDYYDDLDDKLSEDLKEKSEGYYKPENKSMFNLEDVDEAMYYKALKAAECAEVWVEHDSRKEAPVTHFLDLENRKYPYRNQDGSVNAKALSVLCDYADGRDGVVKRPFLGARAKRLFVKTGKE